MNDTIRIVPPHTSARLSASLRTFQPAATGASTAGGSSSCMHFINAAHAKHCFPAGTIFRLSAGQTGLVMHDFRHCYVTHKRRQGHDRSIIKKQVGHHSDSMFEWYNDIEDYELQEMAGYTKRNLDVLETEVSELLRKAKAAEIPLGAVQSLIGRLWNVKVER